MSDVQRELKELNFKEEVLKKEKQLLVQFANIVSKIHSVKVQPVCYSVCVCVCVCVSDSVTAEVDWLGREGS